MGREIYLVRYFPRVGQMEFGVITSHEVAGFLTVQKAGLIIHGPCPAVRNSVIDGIAAAQSVVVADAKDDVPGLIVVAKIIKAPPGICVSRHAIAVQIRHHVASSIGDAQCTGLGASSRVMDWA